MTVYLVGAGPGDPGLLTLRGAELLRRADVVVHDRLSAEELLELAPTTAERIDVGKSPGHARVPQEGINRLLVEHGRTGKVVVRLKGGDPTVFARGGEEALALAEAGVPFEIVPGITSAIAVPAYAGIPVTQRFSSTSFTVVTGHEDPSIGADGSVDWDAVARVGGTIVILMGVGRIDRICERLLAAGRPPDTPAAAVIWGTRPEQRTVRATLGTLADQDLESPATIVIGAVASLDLAWFERRPLFGRTVVVTRARAQASGLVDRLRELGAATVEIPAIRIDDAADGGAALAAAVEQLAAYDWVVLTSPNGARRLLAACRDARAFGPAKVAAIGPGTADALREGNIAADLVPERFVAEGLLEVFPDPPAAGGRVLIARAAEARDVLPETLRDRGWHVDVVEAYRTVAGEPTPAELAAVAGADVVTFTSSSTVRNFLAVCDTVPPVVACIGPVTAATARELGLTVDVEAAEHTIDGLLDALVHHLSAP
ncbi:MAG TPA: uroporphyrinogen-III C-methyltransferase [Acidimicrobiales bacterium]|nr:uroporphyrinogen-III C-methyltransferase [Acidimicrobiales bacterium]